LLAHRNAGFTSFAVSRGRGDGQMSLRILAEATDPNEIDLLVRRLNRLVDVVDVVIAAQENF
jgi:acetolactate synthase regulatory subunit